MSQSQARDSTVVCLASFFKGNEFLRECKRQGWRVILLTREKMLAEDWARESLDDIAFVPDDADTGIYLYAIGQIGRPQKIDCIVALEEYDVETAALAREHLCMDGMTGSAARVFRDKLAMRVKAKQAGIRVPEFVHVLNYQELGEFMHRVESPWVMKPRSDVSAMGIRKMEYSEQVWRAIDLLDSRERLRERAPFYLLERFVPGDVYHVDSLVQNGEVVFAGVNTYARPPMEVTNQGGVYISRTVEHGSQDREGLLSINQQLIKALGLMKGAAHAEFIKSKADGEFYFLEIAARVGGAYTAEVLEAASNVNLWREWARLELLRDGQQYQLPETRQEYAGVALSLSKQEWPDTTAYVDPEIVYRVSKRHHVGLVVRSKELSRVEELLDQYSRRFTEDFSAVMPPLERPE